MSAKQVIGGMVNVLAYHSPGFRPKLATLG